MSDAEKKGLLDFIRTARADKKNEKTIFKLPKPDAAESANLSDWSGLDLSDFGRTIDSFAIRHIFKKHGSEASEAARGQVAVVEEDFLEIPSLVSDFDERILETNRIGNRMILYKKEMSGARVVFAEEVRSGRRELAAQTLFKKKIRKPQ